MVNVIYFRENLYILYIPHVNVQDTGGEENLKRGQIVRFHILYIQTASNRNKKTEIYYTREMIRHVPGKTNI